MAAPIPADAGPIPIHRDVALGIAEMTANPDMALAVTVIDPTRQAVVDSARDRLSLGKAEESLKIISGDIVPYREEETKRVLINKLSTKRDAEGRKTTPSGRELSRLTSAQTEVNNVRDFLEKGAAAPAAHVAIRNIIKNHLYTNDTARHDLFDSMGGIGAAAVDAHVDGLMQQPGFRKELQDRFAVVMNPKTGKLAGESIVAGLFGEVKTLEAKLSLVPNKALVDAAKIELDTAKAERLKVKAKEDQLDEKKSQRSRLERSITEAQATVDAMADSGYIDVVDTEIGRVSAELAAQVPGTAAYNGTLKTLQALQNDNRYVRFNAAQGIVTRYDNLTKDIDSLSKTVSAKIADETAKKEAYDTLLGGDKGLTPEQKAQLQVDLDAKKSELADAKDDLEMEMIEFHRDITHMAQDAMDKTVNASYDAAKSTYREESLLAAEKCKTADQERAQNAADKVANLWKTQRMYKPNLLERKFRRQSIQYRVWEKDPRKIDGQMQRLMRGGPSEIATFVVSRPDAELVGAGFTLEEAQAYKRRLTDDPDFMKTQATRISQDLMADYFSAGGTMTRPVVESIVSTSWGNDLFDKAVEKSKGDIGKFKAMKPEFDELNALRKEGRLHEALVHNATGKRAALLALFLTSLGLAGMGAHGVTLLGGAGVLKSAAGAYTGGLHDFLVGSGTAAASAAAPAPVMVPFGTPP